MTVEEEEKEDALQSSVVSQPGSASKQQLSDAAGDPYVFELRLGGTEETDNSQNDHDDD